MKRKPLIIVGMAALFIIPIVATLVFFLTQTHEQTIENLYFVDGNDNEAILKKVDPYVDFEFILEEGTSILKLEVLDSSNHVVDTSLKLNEPNLILKAPKEGYGEGQYYTVTLPQGVSFKADDLKGVRILRFVVDRPDIIEGTLTDSVIEVDNNQIISFTDTQIMLKSNEGLSVGKIVLFEKNEKGFYQASKIESISQSGTAFKVEVSAPKLDEIYSDLNIHKTFDFMAENMVTEVFEDEVVNFVEKAGFLDFLFHDVKAASVKESFSIDTMIDNKNTAVSFIFIAKNSTQSTWIDGKIGITFTVTIKLTPEFDIRGFSYIDTQYTAVISTKLELTTEDGKTMNEEDFVKILEEGRKLNKQESTLAEPDESFTKMYTDFANEWSDNFDGNNNTLNDNRTCIELRIPIYYTINLVLDFGLNVDFSYMIRTNTKMEYQFTLAGGVSIIDGKFEGYMNKPTSSRDGSFEARGELNLSVMPFVQINAELAPHNFIGLNLSAGPYADLQGFLKCEHIFDVKSLKDIDGIYNIELGLKFKAYIDGEINIFIYKKEFAEKEIYNRTVALAEWGNNYQVKDVTISDKFYVGTGYLKLNNILVDYVDFFSGEVTQNKIDIKQTIIEVNNDAAPYDDSMGAFVLKKDKYQNMVNLKLEWIKRIRPTDSWGITTKYSKQVEFVYKPYDILIEPTYTADTISPLNSKFSAYRVGNLYGLIDYEGKVTIQPAYSSAFLCSDGYISLGGIKKVNEDGSLFSASCEPKEDEPQYLSVDKKIYTYVSNQLIELPENYKFVNVQNVVFRKVDPKTNTILNDYAIGDIVVNGSDKYSVVLDTPFDLDTVSGWYMKNTSVAAYKNDGVWRLFNYDDTIKTHLFDNIEFTDAKLNTLFDDSLFSDDGYATVKTDGGWKIITVDNETLYGEANQDLSIAYGEYVWFKQGGKWGLIGLR